MQIKKIDILFTKAKKSFWRFKVCQNCNKLVIALELARVYNGVILIKVFCPNCLENICLRQALLGDDWLFIYWM